MTNGRVLSFLGTKGGVGQSLLINNLAMALAQREKKKVVILDLNTGLSNYRYLMGLSNIKTLDKVADYLDKNEEIPLLMLRGYITMHGSGVGVLAGFEETDRLSSKFCSKLITFLRQEYDYVLMDLPKRTDPWLVPVLEETDLLLGVAVPDVLSIEQGQMLVKKIISYSFSLKFFRFILNMSDIPGAVKMDYAVRQLQVPVISKLVWEREMDSFLNQGKSIILENFTSLYSQGIFQLVDALKEPELYVRRNASAKEKTTFSEEDKIQIYQYFERVSKEEHVEKKGEELREWVREKLNIILDEELNLNLPREKKEFLVKELLDEILGLGPLEQYLEDPSVTEIMVNGHDKIYIERAGKLTETGKKIVSQQQLMTIIERIVSPLGRRIDESSPMVDARLADGSRVNAIIPPLAIDGATLTIRKFSKKKLGVEELARMNSITPEISAFLEICVKLRKNIIISGGTGSGKTTLLNILSCFIPSDERIVTVEDSAELQLLQPHVVRLESRPPNVEGKGAVPIRQLVINTLRMRPDRIVVGECRGGEALDMLQAMNTGHDGSLTTVHANTPKEAMARLETLVMMAGMDLPSRAIREQIAGAIDIIVQTNRFSDGSRKIEAVSEVTGIDESFQIVPQDIFVFEQTGIDPSGGRVLGRFHATGYKPSFLDEIRIHGLSLNTEMFEVRNHVA